MNLPPSISQLITFLSTEDLDKTSNFYTKIIGLELVLIQKSCQIFRTSSESYLGFCSRPDEIIGHPKTTVITFVTEEVDEWYMHLVSQGVNVHKEPVINEVFQIYHFYINDPNGHLVEFQKFLHPFG